MQQISELLGTGAAASTAPARQASDELGQQDFLRLLVAQMKNQDPTKPMDNFQFLSQIAQFGMVDGIQNLEQSFGAVADSVRQAQVIEATALLGRKIESTGGTGHFDGQRAVEGTFEVPGLASGVVLEVRTPDGRLVRSTSFNGDLTGAVRFGWEGLDERGVPATPGDYRFVARGVVDGQSREFDVSTVNTVDSITVASSGEVVLTLSNGEVTNLEAVSRIR